MEIVKHTYYELDGTPRETAVAYFDTEEGACNYVDLFSNTRPYALCEGFCPTFGDLDVDTDLTEEDLEDWYHVSTDQIPHEPTAAPDFSEFEKMRKEFLEKVDAIDRFPRITFAVTEHPEKYKDKITYTMIDPDEGTDTVYRKGFHCTGFGYAVFDRDPVKDAAVLGTIRLSDDAGFCLADLTPVYENIVCIDESMLPTEPMSFKEAYAFADKAYKAYQLHWMALHGYGLSDLAKAVKDVAFEVLLEGDYTITADNFAQFTEYVEDSFNKSAGFGGNIFACRDEFIRTEFQNPDYMRILLSFMGENKWAIGTWSEAVKTINTSHLYATNIVWDTDGEDVDLPDEIEIPDPEWDDQQISDYITEETGFCHRGFALVQR